MTTSTLDAPPGVRQPRICNVPPYVQSSGDEAVELAASAGLKLDPWQADVLKAGLGERADGKWSAFENAVLVSRQNGKGAILEARQLAGLFILGERLIIHSSHHFKTSVEAFRRVLSLIENTPDLKRMVRAVHTSHGNEGIELKSGQRLRFLARTGGSGRGFSGDCIILDEAFCLGDGPMSALMPTMSARPNPQLWYASSAGNVHMPGHDPVVLGRVVRRGRSGGDPSLAYFEWSVGDDYDPDDPDDWARANPGLGIRISAEHVKRERAAMSSDVFACERLGIGDYPLEGEDAQVIPADIWELIADRNAPPSSALRPIMFSFDVSVDRTRAAIAVAGRRPDGLIQVEIADHRKGTGWVVPRLKELRDRWQPARIVVDIGSPAASLLPELADADIRFDSLGAMDIKQACGGFYDAAIGGTFRHLDQKPLNEALAGAGRKDLGDSWVWSRRHSTMDISPLVAATNARYALTVHADPLDNIW